MGDGSLARGGTRDGKEPGTTWHKTAARCLHGTRVVKHARAQAPGSSCQRIRRFGGLSWFGCCALLACGGGTPEPAPEDPSQAAPGPRDVAVYPVVEPTYQPDIPVEAPPPATDNGAGGGTANPVQCPDPSYPRPQWSPTEWVRYVPVVPADRYFVDVMLDDIRAAMVGSWHGVANTPWTEPYAVDLTFSDDGHYSSRCSDFTQECCLAFYYGTDRDTPLKQWRIESAALNGEVSGEIDIAFDNGPASQDGQYGLPSWQGKLSHIERDATGDGLRFEFSRSDGYGPVSYDLRRVQ